MLSELARSHGSPGIQFSPQEKPRKNSQVQEPGDFSNEKDLPLYSDASFVLLGQPGIIKHHVLNDRIHVITQDSAGCIFKWNVLTARKVEDIGVADWEETIAKNFQLLSIPQWFRVDHTTGSPRIHLDLAQCFNAVIDNSLLELPKPPPRSNVGHILLNTLFSTWCERKRELELANGKVKEDEEQKENQTFEMSQSTPVSISNTNTGRNIFCSTIGNASATDKLPAWVEDCVLRGEFITREQNKYSFFVKPDASEKLPSIGENRLSSLRWLTVKKILGYVVTTLGVSLPIVPGESETEEVKVAPEDYLELLCNGELLDITLDLAAIKTFYWKSGNDIILNYRRKEIYQNDSVS